MSSVLRREWCGSARNKQYLHKADCGSKRQLLDLGHAAHAHAHGTRVIGGNKVTAKRDNNKYQSIPTHKCLA